MVLSCSGTKAGLRPAHRLAQEALDSSHTPLQVTCLSIVRSKPEGLSPSKITGYHRIVKVGRVRGGGVPFQKTQPSSLFLGNRSSRHTELRT